AVAVGRALLTVARGRARAARGTRRRGQRARAAGDCARKPTSRGGGCRDDLCRRGWSRRVADDREPVGGFVVVGGETQGLAKEDRGGFVLVAARGELAEQAIRDAALRFEPDDVAQIRL